MRCWVEQCCVELVVVAAVGLVAAKAFALLLSIETMAVEALKAMMSDVSAVVAHLTLVRERVKPDQLDFFFR